MKTPLKGLRFVAVLLMLAASPAHAALDPAAMQKLTAGDGEAGDLFGNAVSLAADSRTVLIGAIYDDDHGKASGSAYVFTRTADGKWTQQAKLTAADAASYFGCAVALSADGRTALVGAEHDDGAAYVFTRAADGKWTQQAKLTATAPSTLFGGSVSLSADGQVALVGAGWDDDKGENAGAVYVFSRAADGKWTQQAKLTAADSGDGDAFGGDVVLSSDSSTALIGAGADNNQKGSAYVFSRAADGKWTQQAKLTAADGDTGDQFGNALFLSKDGGAALIGALGDDDKGSASGSAYVFTRAADGKWAQQAKLTAADGAENSQFGWAAALSADGGMALVGAGAADSRKGAAYLFSRGADGKWSQQQKLSPADGSSGLFGVAVGLSPDSGTALIGAGWDGKQKGAAYIYSPAVARP